jgi:hypothetical protein
MQLKQIREACQQWLDALQIAGESYGCLRGGPDQPPDFYASADAAIIRTVWGEQLAHTIDAADRSAWIAYLHRYADPRDGSYQTFTHHSKLHANGTAIGALGALGGRMAYPVRLYDAFDTPAKVEDWLEGIDWAAQWTASHLFWGGMHCFSLSRRATPAWRERVFGWLDANLDPDSGWWRRGVPHTDRHQPLGGSVHILPIYEHHQRAFPYPERLIDSVLALQLPDGRWLQDAPTPMTYLDLDALYALKFARALAPAYRTADITHAVRRYADLVQEQWRDALDHAFAGHPHYLLSVIGTFGLLQRFDPQTFIDDRPWSDIFSDPALYRVAEVEQQEMSP